MMIRRFALIAALAALPAAAFAQHEGHDMPASHAPASGPAPTAAPPASSSHHADHGPAAPASPAAPQIVTPPLAEAGAGPARAADAIWGTDAMSPSRDALRQDHGAANYALFAAERAEYRLRRGQDGYLWDMQAYYGSDRDRIWLKSEGEGTIGGGLDTAEVQALWSRPIGPFFDMQAGIRQDLAGPARTHAVIGVQGLAPYRFELDAAAFLSHRGELTGRVTLELDERITQRLILQPHLGVDLSAQHIPQLGIGAGIDRAELGLRLRYEIVREFAPYIGVEQEWRIGRGATYARAAGEDASVTNYVVGVRFWF